MAYIGLLVGMICSFLLCNLRDWKLCFNRNKKIYMILFSFCCILLMGLRSDAVGYDTATYKNYFTIVEYTPIKVILGNFYFQSMEIGFALLMKICSCISSSYFFFQFIVSAVYCSGMALFIYRNSQNCIFASFIFLGIGLFLTAFNVQRQMLAVMLVVNSWGYFASKQYIKMLLLLTLAITVHTASIIFIIAYVIYLFRQYRIVYLFFVVGIVISIFYYDKVIDLAIQYLPIYNNYYSNTKEILSVGFVKVLWGIIIALSLAILIKGNKEIISLRVYAVFSILYVVSNIIGLEFNYFERLGWFFLPFVVLLFDGFGSIFHNLVIKTIYYGGVLLSFIFYFILSTQSEQYIYSIWF